MEFFETRLLPSILPTNVTWHRYVDDIFCIWPVNVNIHNFLKSLNNLVFSIKFTLEEEVDCKLPFLDVLVHRHGRHFKFDVYRKATNVNSYIHYYSENHIKVKLSVFSSMFLRALRICSPEFMEFEMMRIRNIALKLKYPKHLTDKSLQMAERTFYNPNNNEPFNKKNMLVLPYNSNFLGIVRLLKNFRVNVVFKNASSVSSILIKNSPSISPGSIYSIPCKNCNKKYIGQTEKELDF